MNYDLISITTVKTEKLGELSFFEAEREIPFEIKRIYYIHSVPAGSERGAHAHKQLKQLLFCPYGSVEIILDDGKKKQSVMLDKPGKGLVLYPGLWRDMKWHTDNAVLCVAASDYYDESDYIRDYDEFIKYIEEGIND